MIFTSSMAVYGDQTPPFMESMIPKPADPYGIAKYAVEMDLEQASSQFGLKYNIVRPHNVVGIYQNIWDIYRNVIGIFIKKTIDNQPMIIYGDGKQTRAFSDIKYCLNPLYLLSTNHDNETFNIGADKYFSINQIADIIIDIAPKFNLKASKIYEEPRHEVKHAFCDHNKAKNILNFNDETNIENLIEEMFQWSILQPKRESKLMKYEIDNGMYSYWKQQDVFDKNKYQYSELKTEYIDTQNPKRSRTVYS
jgi:UDP-glucose 4-epimerase